MPSIVSARVIVAGACFYFAAGTFSPVSQNHQAKDLPTSAVHHIRMVQHAYHSPAQLRAMKIWRELGGEYASHSHYGLMNLRILFKPPGDLTRAVEAYREVVELSESASGYQDVRTAGAMTNLAEGLAVIGELAQAEKALDEALRIQRAIGVEGLELAKTLNDLSFLCTLDGRSAEAEKLLRQASDIAVRLPGRDSLEAILLLASVAALHSIRGDSAHALLLVQQAVANAEREFGPNDPGMGILLSQRGMLLVSRNDVDPGIADLTRAVRILQTSKGTNSREFAVAEVNLGIASMAGGQFDDAAQLLEDAAKIRRAANRTVDIDLGSILLQLGECLMKQRKYAEAIACLRECSTAYQSATEPNHPDAKRASSLLANALKAAAREPAR